MLDLLSERTYASSVRRQVLRNSEDLFEKLVHMLLYNHGWEGKISESSLVLRK